MNDEVLLGLRVKRVRAYGNVQVNEYPSLKILSTNKPVPSHNIKAPKYANPGNTMMATLPTKMSKFNFKGLSPEIRLMIYPLSRNLMQGFDGTLPALLLALKGGDQTMYEEAYHAYLKTNLIVSEDTFESLKQIPEKEMMKVQHLKIVWTDQGVHTR